MATCYHYFGGVFALLNLLLFFVCLHLRNAALNFPSFPANNKGRKEKRNQNEESSNRGEVCMGEEQEKVSQTTSKEMKQVINISVLI